ncbi:TIGR00153 family protein [Magnetococcales bacterium HHB-1]
MGLTNALHSLFGKSPFKPMQRHMRKATECTAQITELIKALEEGDKKEVKSVQKHIFHLEHEADEIKHALRTRLPKSLLMPVDRRDLLELLDLQDNIADTVQDIARLMINRNMNPPLFLKQHLLDLVSRCEDACQQACSIIEALDELVEMGFGGREASRVLNMANQLNEIEHDTDELEAQLIQTLFHHEDQLSPTSVIFWHQLICSISNLADYAEKIGNRVRLLLAR